MPKRTNEFQRLVAKIEDVCKGPNARVIESHLDPSDPQDPGEIDVLVEDVINDTRVRVAFECRDHGRKANIEWIHNLIGKYAGRNVDVVVAVSSKGFSRRALIKAKENRIRAYTLREALDSDWTDMVFQRPLAEHVLLEAVLEGISLRVGPESPESLDPLTCTIELAGKRPRPALVLGRELFEATKLQALPPILTVKGIHPSGKEVLPFNVEVPLQSERPMTVISPDGHRYPLRELTLSVRGTARLGKLEQKDYRYDKRMATTVRLRDESGAPHDFMLVQSAGKEELRWRYDRGDGPPAN